MRGWGASTFTPAPLRDLVCAKLCAPICFNPVASRTVLPLQELRARFGMEGETPGQIAEGVSSGIREQSFARAIGIQGIHS
jgi:hypothetical protein